MNLFQIILKQMRQRSLSTWLTLLSVLLGTALAVGILILQRESNKLFAQTDFGYDLLIGPPKGSPLQLTLNTVYHLDVSPGVVPYALYADLSRKGAAVPGRPNFGPLVRSAIPFMVGDSFAGRRIIGTSPLMFGIGDDGKPVTGEAFQYRKGESYKLASGRVFAPRRFEAVIGSNTAEALKLKLYDESKSEADNLTAGGAFRATHGMPGEGEEPDVHKPVWRIVGILERTDTANDRVIFVPYVSLYAIAEHEEGMIDQALMRARIDPSKIPPERVDEVLRQLGVDPTRIPEAMRRKFKLDRAGKPATAATKDVGELIQEATVPEATKEDDHGHDHDKDGKEDHAAEDHDKHAEAGHDDHAGESPEEHAAHAHEHDEHESYSLDEAGNIVPDLPQEEWQLSAILVKSRGGFQNQQLSYMFKVIDDRATAVNPASVMRDFFNTFLASTTKILLVIAILVIVVAGASIMTTIYNSVSARLREIAILRALGATRQRILTMISLEAALIGVVGGALGIIVAHLACALGSAYLKRTVGESIDWMKVSPAELYCFVGVVVLSFLAGLVPAMKAYRTSVADNLTAA